MTEWGFGPETLDPRFNGCSTTLWMFNLRWVFLGCNLLTWWFLDLNPSHFSAPLSLPHSQPRCMKGPTVSEFWTSFVCVGVCVCVFSYHLEGIKKQKGLLGWTEYLLYKAQLILVPCLWPFSPQKAHAVPNSKHFGRWLSFGNEI